MKSCCFFCFAKTKFAHALVCTECYVFLQQQRWVSCTRCGRSSCSGCDELADFKNVMSLYAYQKTLADILVLAKEQQHPSLCQVFEELFFVPVMRALSLLFLRECYDFVVLSPLRKERFFSSRWHSNLFFAKVFDALFQQDLLNYPKLISSIYSKKKTQQSTLPRNVRNKESPTQSHEILQCVKENRADFISESGLEPFNSRQKPKILFVDDVLTTGNTASMIRMRYEAQFPQAVWDIFTLFRAPVSEPFGDY
jgi:predicted amidophosphoribosyltransferase